jgi:hypothetical protein
MIVTLTSIEVAPDGIFIMMKKSLLNVPPCNVQSNSDSGLVKSWNSPFAPVTSHCPPQHTSIPEKSSGAIVRLSLSALPVPPVPVVPPPRDPLIPREP